ncbi:MAG TPA: hypothetical protein VMN82_16945, partial [Thermoanaerobaculia bacterium]|nr:hypothetical protein [Thermoanaerobaculia bacterium]
TAAPAAAQSRLEKDLSLAPGGEFRLETDMGSVTVTGSSDAGAHLLITSKRKDLDELLTFRFDEGAGSVAVIAKKKHRSWFSSESGSVHYEIRVPAQTRLSIDTSGGAIKIAGLRSPAKLDTSGGGIKVDDLVGDLDADTSGGSIDLKDIKGKVRVVTSGGGIDGANLDGPVHAESSGGSIELQKVTGDIDAETSGGGIRIADAGGRVHADTSGGSIEASFTKGNSAGGTLETSGGGIEVSVDPEANLSIQASGNSVKTELPIRVQGEISRGSLSGSLGKGGNTLRLHTSGGSVRIQSL